MQPIQIPEEAVPLLLLHGISSCEDSWHKQRSLTGVNVLAWNMPGYLDSPPLATTKPTALDYAKALCQWLNRAQIKRVVLVGHSLGAMVASAFAANYPERVVRLVLADVARGYGGYSNEQQQQLWLNRKNLMAAGGEEMAKLRAARLLKTNASHEDIATVCAGMRRLNPQGYLSAAWMLTHDNIYPWLEQYNGAFEVWCGEYDSITQPEQVQLLAEHFSMPYYSIPQAGHLSYLDNAAAFNQQLLRVIGEL